MVWKLGRLGRFSNECVGSLSGGVDDETADPEEGPDAMPLGPVLEGCEVVSMIPCWSTG